MRRTRWDRVLRRDRLLLHERLAAGPEPPFADRRSGWPDPPGLPWCGTRVFIGSDGVRPHLGERLEFSHGLVAALGEPLTLRLGLHPGDLYLNPPTTVRPERNTTALMAK